MAKILVVEDDEPMKNILVETLADDGHAVEFALDGKQAFDVFPSGEFDLVITDVRLPGMDGVEVLSRLKKRNPGLLSIVMTGYAADDIPARAIALRVDDYLIKPFSLRYFLSSVNRVLDIEGRKKKKHALVEMVFHFFGTPRAAIFDELSSQRWEAFRGLYVGVRSGFLTRRDACALYLRLEGLEVRYRALLNIEEPTSTRIEEMLAAYGGLKIYLTEKGIGSTDVDVSVDELASGDLTGLFEVIKKSDVGLDDVQYAPLLRTAEDEEFGKAHELFELKQKLWPELTSSR